MRQCRSLAEYAQFTQRAREAMANAGEGSRREALEEAVDRCIRDDILREFLKKNREDIIMSYYWEYDQEEHEAALREDGEAKGKKEGTIETLQLVNWLIKNGRLDEISKMETDEDLQNRLKEEFANS